MAISAPALADSKTSIGPNTGGNNFRWNIVVKDFSNIRDEFNSVLSDIGKAAYKRAHISSRLEPTELVGVKYQSYIGLDVLSLSSFTAFRPSHVIGILWQYWEPMAIPQPPWPFSCFKACTSALIGPSSIDVISRWFHKISAFFSYQVGFVVFHKLPRCCDFANLVHIGGIRKTSFNSTPLSFYIILYYFYKCFQSDTIWCSCQREKAFFGFIRCFIIILSLF